MNDLNKRRYALIGAPWADTSRWLDSPALRYGLLLLCILAHAALFLWIYPRSPLYFTGADTGHVYWPAVQKVLGGRVPYRDFFVEYPPLGAVVFLLPAALHPSSLASYDRLFAAEMLLADIAILLLIGALARRLRVSVSAALITYAITVPLLGGLIAQRFDLAPAALTLAALLALLNGRSPLAWGLLLLATLTKVYPAVLAPLFLLYDAPRGRRAGVAIYVCGLAAFAAAWGALAPSSLARFLQYETQRGIEVESLFGSLVELLRLRGLPVRSNVDFGSYNVVSVLSPTLMRASSALTLLTLGLLYLSYARRIAGLGASRFRAGARNPAARARPAWREGRALVTYAALAVLGLMLCSKILSIQYLLWLLPLLAVQPRHIVAVAALGLSIVLLSHWIYPSHWPALWMDFQPRAILVMALRNMLLVAVFALLWRDRAALSPSPGATGAPASYDKRRA